MLRNTAWRTAPQNLDRHLLRNIGEMEKHFEPPPHGNKPSNLMEPLLGQRLDSVSQISERRSRSRVTSLRSSRISSSSSVPRRKALAEVAAAKQEAEFDCLLAEKEHERLEMEEEEERKRQSTRAKFECDMAMLTANKKSRNR